MRNSNKQLYRPDFQCITVDISTWQQELKKPIIPITLTAIGIPQISGGCPYKVLNSQWVPTRPDAMLKTKNKQKNVTMLHDHDKLLNHVSSNPQEIFCYPDNFECINKCCQHKYQLQITTRWIFCPIKNDFSVHFHEGW